MAQPNLLFGAAQQFIEAELGGPTDEDTETVTVGTEATQIVGNNSDVVAMYIINTGQNPLYIGLSPQQHYGEGILLVAAGGSVSMDVREDYTLPSREWFGVSTDTGTTCYVIRIRRFTIGVG